MKIDILTIFPDFFRGPLDFGIIRRAREMGLVEIGIHDLRNFTKDKHRTVDDRPFGGGEGMVLKPEPIFECLESLGGLASRGERLAAARDSGSAKQSVILLSAQGRTLNQSLAGELSALDRMVLICGRYEGVDERISEHLADREISVGDYVLSGGELGAAVIVDTVTRLIPGAVGNQNVDAAGVVYGGRERVPARTRVADVAWGGRGRFGYAEIGRVRLAVRADCWIIRTTRGQRNFAGMAVPEVLVNGNHEQIRRWRRRTALAKTLRNRPDLLERVALSRGRQGIARRH